MRYDIASIDAAINLSENEHIHNQPTCNYALLVYSGNILGISI